MIKNKKGFTLIELLAVIIVLSIIMVLIIPKTTKVIKKTQLKSIETSTQGLIRAIRIAKHEYAFDNEIKNLIFTFNDGNEEANVPNLTLEYTGKKPENGTIIIDQDGKIALALHDGKYCIEKDYENDDIIITKMLLNDCNLNIPIYYTDASGANPPELLTGMIPIKWDDDNIEMFTTEDDEDWYDYENIKWANAKTTDGSYWVWIPRYAYKITDGFHQTMEEGGTIDIKFLRETTNNPLDDTPIEISGYNGTTKNTSNNYFLHPAFKFGEDDIPGFWVAKFEPSEESNQIQILPNKSSLRGLTVGVFYDKTQNMKSYICNSNCDTHIMKNMEWGAVAYLSQSEYGAKAEVYKNNSSTYITGCAGNEKNSNKYSGCQNEWDTNGGVKASTTHNITGIYDMSGGAWEYVMGNLDKTQGNSELNLSGVDSKYIDFYEKGTLDTAQNNYEAAMDIYGDAIWETSSNGSSTTNAWYKASNYFIDSSVPWLIRGGGSGNTCAGTFHFYFSYGIGGSNGSFRPIVIP